MNTVIKRLLTQNKHIMHSLLGNFLPILVGICSMPILHKQLGEDRFGVIILIWITSNLVSLLDFGTVRVVTQTLAKFKIRDVPLPVIEMCQSVLVFLVMLSFGLFALGYFFRSSILKVDLHIVEYSEVAIAFYITLATVPFILITSLLKGILESQMKFGLANAIRVPMMSYLYIVPIFVVYLVGKNLIIISLALALGRIFFLVIYAYFVMKECGELFFSWHTSFAKCFSLLKGLGWFAVIATLSPILGFLDRLFINNLISTTVAGFYATPYEVVSRMSLVAASISSVLIPVLMKCHMENEKMAIETAKTYMKIIYYALMVPCLVLVLFSRDILAVWMGGGFAINSFMLLKIFSLGMLLNSVCSVPSSFMLVRREEKKLGMFYCLQMLLYPVALFVGIRSFGMIGGAVVWFLRILCDLIFFVVATVKVESNVFIKFKMFKNILSFIVLSVFVFVEFNLVIKVLIILIYSALSISSLIETQEQGINNVANG